MPQAPRLAPNKIDERLADLPEWALVDGKLILQGAEDGYQSVRDGLGWTIAIAEDTGRVVMTASGDQVAFVVFGACLPF